MNATEQKAFELALPLIQYGLQLLLPEVPAPVWTFLFAAIKAGDGITADQIRAELKNAGVTVSYTPADFPEEPPGDKLEDANAV